jgi:hypothetical protein
MSMLPSSAARGARLLVLGLVLSVFTACKPDQAPPPPPPSEPAPPPHDARLDEQPTAPFSADQVLNNDMPGRKPSPVIDEVENADGFAKERLYHVPPVGVHPRILFGPEDLPRIRQQLAASKLGQTSLALMRKLVANTIDKPGTPEYASFQALEAGDPSKVQAFFDVFKKHPAPGSASNPVLNTLADKAFLALLDDNKSAGHDVAKAATALAVYLEPQIDAATATPGGDDYWRAVRNVCGGGPALAYIYDFNEPYMTPEQAETFRRILSKATKNHYVLGMDLPRHWRNWNFIGMAEEFPLLALAIEGEEGYDARVYQRGAEVAHDYANYSLSANGIAKEAIGYHTAGIGHLSQLLLAMANRGDNVFIKQKFRNQADVWFVWALQPYGGEWQSSGDLGTFPPSLETLRPLKFFYPHDPKIDYVYQNQPVVRGLHAPDISIFSLITPADPDKKDGALVDYKNGAVFGLGNSLYDPERGYLFARSDWNADGTYLQIAARNDTRFVSHDDADRGTFYLTAMGRPWSVTNFREIEGTYSNTVNIDGEGEGYAPTPATWLGTVDGPQATFGAVDLSYCYDWKWTKWPIIMPEAEYQKKPWLSSYDDVRKRLAPRYANVKWERDPSPLVADYYSGYLAGDPGMWDEDSWVMRAPFNPVQRAFRTEGLVRGKRPYALIVDDIQKDDAEHLYEWRMTLPNDVEAADISGNDITLVPISGKRVTELSSSGAHHDIGKPLPAPGTPELLVRGLNINGPDVPTRQPGPRVETYEFLRRDDSHAMYLRSTGMGKRVVLPSRSIAPDYKVLLFPLRAGEKPPVTTWSADGTQLTIEFDGQKDEYVFAKTADGRTTFTLTRDGAPLCDVK